MTRLVKILDKGELSEGSCKVVHAGGVILGVYLVKGQYFATANTCLHRGGPLGEGELDGYRITCPWHGWNYDIRTGSFGVIPTLKVKTYNVKEQGDAVYVEI